MEISKYAIGRLCCINTNYELYITNDQLSSSLETIFKHEKRIKDKKNLILGKLDGLIDVALEIEQKNILINVKRNFEQKESFKEKHLKGLKILSYDELLSEISSFLILKKSFIKQICEFGSVFNNDYQLKKKVLKEIINNELFMNGLQQSSVTLYNSLIKWNPLKDNKKSRQIEKGVLKYVTRSTFKPSPFSSLSNIFLTKIQGIKSENPLVQDFLNASSTVKSYARINTKIFQHVRNFIMSSRSLYSNFTIYLNKTTEFTHEDKIKFFVNKSNYEFFNYLDRNAVIELIIDFLQQGDCIFKELVLYCQKYMDATEDQIYEYIHNLCLLGIIQIDYGFSAVNPNWPKKLLSRLNSFPNSEERQELNLFIKNLLKLKRLYSQSFLDHHQRKECLHKVSDLIGNSFANFEKLAQTSYNYNKFSFKLSSSELKKNIFFEDTKANIFHKINKDLIESKIKNLNVLYNLSLSYSEAKKEPLKQYFKCNIGSKIPLLVLYEKYYKFLKENKSYTSDFEIDDEIDLSNFNINFTKENFTVKFNPTKKNLESVKYNYSCGMYFMFTSLQKPNDSILVNALTWGYGRSVNRFLYMFDRKVLTDQKRLNKRLSTKDKLHSEVIDSSLFNANVHEPVFDVECFIPGGQSNLEKDNQLHVSDLEVRFNEEKDSLELFHKEKEIQVMIQDSSLQGFKGRSELYNLLLNFTDRVSPNAFSIFRQINSKFKRVKDSNIYCYPRIVYCENIILQRQYWLIKKEEYPQINERDEPITNFIEINRWIKSLGIPNKVFITINFLREKSDNFKKNDYKPQFIDFGNSIFLNTLLSVFSRNEAIKITECLPNSKDWKYNNNQVHEYVTQWYNGSNYEE